MRQLIVGGLMVLTGLAVGLPAARARVMAPAPVPERVALADAVIVGKVTAVEDKADKAGQAVAVVKVDEALVGANGLTHVRVGFSPQPNPRFPHLNLKPGQEACFFLKKHPTETHFVTAMYFDVMPRGDNPTFDKDMAVVRQCARLLKDPNASLKGAGADDRFLTAAMLVARYRTPPPGDQPPKQEPIDAEQSKLILLTLAEADWNKPSPFFRVTPLATFFRIAPQPADGWTTPKNFKDVPDAARKWLKDNSEKYRIQRFVAATPEKR